jgi:uncharacterized repeat protein (TIGR03803 family)
VSRPGASADLPSARQPAIDPADLCAAIERVVISRTTIEIELAEGRVGGDQNRILIIPWTPPSPYRRQWRGVRAREQWRRRLHAGHAAQLQRQRRGFAGLIADAAGDLFGTTASGGAPYNRGTVFELVNHGGGAYTPVTLLSFTNGNPESGIVRPIFRVVFGCGSFRP